MKQSTIQNVHVALNSYFYSIVTSYLTVLISTYIYAVIPSKYLKKITTIIYTTVEGKTIWIRLHRPLTNYSSKKIIIMLQINILN